MPLACRSAASGCQDLTIWRLGHSLPLEWNTMYRNLCSRPCSCILGSGPGSGTLTRIMFVVFWPNTVWCLARPGLRPALHFRSSSVRVQNLFNVLMFCLVGKNSEVVCFMMFMRFRPVTKSSGLGMSLHFWIVSNVCKHLWTSLCFALSAKSRISHFWCYLSFSRVYC